MIISSSLYLIILLFAAFEASLIIGRYHRGRGEAVSAFHTRPLCLLAGLLADGLAFLVVAVSASRVTVVELYDPEGLAIHRLSEYKVYGTPDLVTPLKDVFPLYGKDIRPFRRYLANNTDKTFLIYPIEYANDHTHPKYYRKPDEKIVIGPGKCVRIRHRPDYWFMKPPRRIDGIPLDDTGLPRTEIKWAIRECEATVRDSSVVSRHEDMPPTRTGRIVNKKKW